MVSAIVLAAGESQRMGAHNKLLLPFGRQTLIERVVDSVLDSAAAEVIVVVGHQADKITEKLRGRPLRFIANHEFQRGMTTSIRAGVGAASQSANGFMICLSDLPLIKPQELGHLIHAFETALINSKKRIIVPIHQNRRGNPVIFSAEFRNDILAHKGLKGCKGLIKENPDKVLEVEMASDNILKDIDNVEDYEELARLR